MKILNSYTYLSFALLVSSVNLTNPLYAATQSLLSIDTLAPSNKKDSTTESLVNSLLDQINMIDLKVEEIAQALANNIIEAQDKKAIQKNLLSYRKYFSIIRKKLKDHPRVLSLQGILDNNRTIIFTLNHMLKNGIDTLKLLNHEVALKKLHIINNRELSISTFNNSFTILNKHLENLYNNEYKDPKNTVTKTAKIINTTQAFLKDWYIKQTLAGTAPYAGLATLCIVNTEDNNLPKSLLAYKRFVLRPFKYFQQPETTTSSTPPNLPENTEEDSIRVIREDNRLARNLTNTRKEVGTYKDTGLSSTYKMLKKVGLVDLDTRPYFSISLIAFVVPFIKRDIVKTKDSISKQVEKALTYLKGDKYEDGPAKVSKTKFNDIIGYQAVKDQLQEPITYFKNKNKFKALGIIPKKGYLISGDAALAEEFGKALAGEISTQLDSSKPCKVFSIDPADLIKRGLKQIADENKKDTPLVIILKEIDFISEQSNSDYKVLSTLAKDLDKLLNDKDTNIIIIGTAQDSNLIHNTLTRSERFGNVLKIESPTAQDRYLFLEKEFLNNCLCIDDFDLNQLTHVTEGYNYGALKQFIRKAQYNARVNHTIVTQEDFTI